MSRAVGLAAYLMLHSTFARPRSSTIDAPEAGKVLEPPRNRLVQPRRISSTGTGEWSSTKRAT